jgi:hypothetical protein
MILQVRRKLKKSYISSVRKRWKVKLKSAMYSL